MDHSAAIAFAFIIPTRNNAARSALPDAPVVDDGGVRAARTAALRAQLATLLHRLAWAIEPACS